MLSHLYRKSVEQQYIKILCYFKVLEWRKDAKIAKYKNEFPSILHIVFDATITNIQQPLAKRIVANKINAKEKP